MMGVTQYLLTVTLLILGLSTVLVRAEVFSALATLVKSLETEKDVATALRDYVQQERKRLEEIDRVANEYEKHASVALTNPESYIANPINAYMFVKKFTTELPDTKALLQSKDNANAFMDKLSKLSHTLPDEDDLNGVVAAVLRLQDTYQLPASRFVDGTFTPINRSPSMSVADCFQFGVHAHEAKDYYHSIIWMQEALAQLNLKGNSTVSKADILDYLAYALYNQGNMHHARYYTAEWLKLRPDHSRARKNLAFYDSEIAEEKDEFESRGKPAVSEDSLPPLNNPRRADWYRESQEFKDYEALCRGEDLKRNPFEHKLKCYYSEGQKSPHLVLAPVKVEEYYLDPLILVYHDIVSDKEIEVIKNISTPKLKRATVNDPATGKLVTAHYRISRSAWLPDYENDTVAAISKRLSAASHLSVERAELLQVQNYGIGGQYEPHFDFAGNRGADKDVFDKEDGNRVATWIFYYSDVDAGGLTVFTSLGAKVPPKKGTAAFWYNLRKSGAGDKRTRHAGCPVLAGSKWVANKWLHERGQEFMRPCGLTPDE